jgi:hypothetical protein
MGGERRKENGPCGGAGLHTEEKERRRGWAGWDGLQGRKREEKEKERVDRAQLEKEREKELHSNAFEI